MEVILDPTGSQIKKRPFVEMPAFCENEQQGHFNLKLRIVQKDATSKSAAYPLFRDLCATFARCVFQTITTSLLSVLSLLLSLVFTTFQVFQEQ